MPGTRTNANATVHTIHGYNAAAVTAALFITEWIAPYPCRIGAVKVNGRTAGTGGGNTVMDILKNGVSIYTTTANRPTLLATSTGEFANTNPDTKGILQGDVIALQALTVSTTGHAAVSFVVAIERA